MKERFSSMVWFLLVFCLFSPSCFLAGQSSWQRTFGGPGIDYARDVVVDEDGSFLIVGGTSSYGAGKFDVLLLKVNQNGEVIFYATFGGREDDWAVSIAKTSDGFIIAGSTRSFGAGGSDIYVVKVDKKGNRIWEKTFGGTGDEFAYAVVAVENGFIVAGSTKSIPGKDRQAYLIRLDSQGNVLWQRDYGGEKEESFFSITPTSDGFLAVGQSGTPGHIDSSGEWVAEYDAYVVKMDRNGQILREEFPGGPYEDGLYRVVRTKDGGYIAVGWSESANVIRGYYVVKFSKDASVLWKKVIETPMPHTGRAIVETSSGYFIVGSGIPLDSPVDDVFLVKIDSKGELVEVKRYGGDRLDTAFSAQAVRDGFVIVGDTASFGTGTDVYILKTDMNGDVSQ